MLSDEQDQEMLAVIEQSQAAKKKAMQVEALAGASLPSSLSLPPWSSVIMVEQ